MIDWLLLWGTNSFEAGCGLMLGWEIWCAAGGDRRGMLQLVCGELGNIDAGYSMPIWGLFSAKRGGWKPHGCKDRVVVYPIGFQPNVHQVAVLKILTLRRDISFN